MNNPSLLKIKSNFGYEKIVKDKIFNNYARTIRYR